MSCGQHDKLKKKAGNMTDTIRIATRKSPLALWQAEHVAAALQSHHPRLTVTLYPLSTEGDRILDKSLAKIGGKGLFIKELEVAMNERRADIAVHSMKDVPAQMPDGFTIAAIMAREDPRDAFVSQTVESFASLPHGARIGTSSLRRQSQLLAQRPDLEVVPLRGNVGTRLRRVEEGICDAAILATAGLKRLGLAGRVREHIAIEQCLPAVGQGAVGIECREGDEKIARLLHPLGDTATSLCVAAERAFAAGLGASCQSPIAAHATIHGDTLTLRGRVVAPDGSKLIQAELDGRSDSAEAIGAALARQALAQGADRILAALTD
jgi:hydroxymethylbilane synthase